MINFTEYFKEEKEIYIQNVFNGQVSLQFGRGDESISFLLTRKRDPIVLTNHVPFKMIAASTDFRKTLNRTPSLVRLLNEKEYSDYYKSKAKAEKVSVDAAIQKAETERATIKSKVVEAPKTTAPADEPAPDDIEDPVSAEETINGRVIHLCHQASAQIPAADRMKPADLLASLKELQGEFKMDDYEYVLAHTGNKSIHSWARGCQKDLTGVEAEVS